MRKHKNLSKLERERERAVELSAAGWTQAAIGGEFGVSAVAIGKLLRGRGVVAKTGRDRYPLSFDLERAERLYLAGSDAESVGVALGGVPASTIRYHLRKKGVTRPKGAQHRCDRAFFSSVDPLRSYWAGFIAADGHLQVRGTTQCVRFGLHPQDRVLLERLSAAAKLSQEIIERPNNSGRGYVWLNVYCKQWVEDLGRNFNIPTGRKSRILRPPELPNVACVWAFVRGYFDGDGGVKKDGRIDFSSASKPFLRWIVRDVLGAAHKISRGKGAWRCVIGGPILETIVSRLYESSTPQTRLARKHSRLVVYHAANKEVATS